VTWVKERLADLAATVASPVAGRWFSGGSMVAIARRVAR